MIRRNSKTSLILLTVVLSVLSATASAEGPLLQRHWLDEKALTAIEAQIAASRKSTPAAFHDVARLRREMPTIDRARRGRLAPMTRAFAASGESATWALVEALMVPVDPSWRATARTAWQAGLVEALGRLQAPALIPLFDALLDHLPSDVVVAREIVVARGLYADGPGAETLAKMASVGGPHRASVLAGLGRCRRLSSVVALASALDAAIAAKDRALIRLVVESLADVGNAWVWQRLPGPHAAEMEPVRHFAADALIRAFGRLDGSERDATANALMVVDAPSTPELIAEAIQYDSASRRADFERLLDRFVRNHSP